MPEKQMTINVPVEKAFAYLEDVSKHREWAKESHKHEAEKTSDGPVGQGTTFKSVGYQFGRNEDTVTIAEYVPNKRVVYESDGNAGKLRHWFDFAPADGGVAVTKGVEVVKGNFPFLLFAPFAMMFVVPGELNGDLERIKGKLEGV